MAQDTRLTKYGPAVLGVTCLAAACGIYYVYYSQRPSTGSLRRSNAIHRPRGERRPRFRITWEHQSSQVPLGMVVLTRNGREMLFDIATGFPNIEHIRATVGPVPGQFYEELINVAVGGILEVCFSSRNQAQLRQNLSRFGLDHLTDAMAAGNSEGVRSCWQSIGNLLGELDPEDVGPAMERFLLSDAWRSVEASGRFSSEAVAETEDDEDDDDDEGDDDNDDGQEAQSEENQGLKSLVYHIAEQDAKRKAYEHRGFHCEKCGERPIRGVRWHCLNCPDFDLCSCCEAEARHPRTHVFAKINVPIPILSQPTKEYRLWYPGDARKLHDDLAAEVSRRLQQAYGFNGPQIDAAYDQFVTIANVPWPTDPNEVCAGIDHRAFRKALSSERWPQRFRPNALYDRMFAFYDTNEDGIIGFEEFLSGLAYLRGPKRFESLVRALKGFDIDGDGFVDRQDFIRLLKAKQEIQELLIYDMVDGFEAAQTQNAMSTIRSSQPIGSSFNIGDIPHGEIRPRTAKTIDAFGDIVPLPGAQTVLGDDDGWGSDEDLPRHYHSLNAQARLRFHLSRFEELLHSSSDEHDSPRASFAQIEEAASQLSSASTGNEDRNESNVHGIRSERNEDHAHDDDTPLNHHALWQIIEDGFHEILDPMFQAKEEEDRQVTRTVVERKKWRAEIDNFVKARSSGMGIDPGVGDPLQQCGDLAYRMELSATDFAALEQREGEISQKSLCELLDESGYTTVDNEVPNESAADQTQLEEVITTAATASEGHSSQAATVAHSEDTAESLPETSSTHHRTSHARKPFKLYVWEAVSPEEDSSIEQPPIASELERMVQLDDAEREMIFRGGPGRLSLHEIECMAKRDPTGDIKGLAIGWLEWASF